MSDPIPGEEGFSLRSFHLNCSFKLYSSDEDDCYDDDADSYIEFELQSATTSPTNLESSTNGYDKEFEFGILVPTFLPLPGFVPSPNINPANSLLSKGEFAKGDDYNYNDNSGSPMARIGTNSSGAIGNCTGPLLRMFRNVGSFSKPIKDGDGDCGINSCKSLELVRSREESTKIISTGSRGAMDLIRSVIISMQMKSTQQSCNKCPISRQRWSTGNSMKPIGKWFTKWRRHDLQLMITDDCGGATVKSKVLPEDLKLVDVFRKLFGNNRVVQRCPTSINSSPVHQSGDTSDSSVCAAIAHCKKSLGHPDDFCF